MNNTISLVIVTFNRSALLKEMLHSVTLQTIKPDHVFIVDNNSSDNTKDVISQFIAESSQFLSISYHNTGENLGGAGGFEFGSRLAFEKGYEWIWLADDDIVLTPPCLEELCKHFASGDILQPIRMNIDGTCAEISGVDYEINNILRLNPKKIRVVDLFDKKWDTLPIKTIPFEGPLINRKVFTSIGFPNKEFFIFYDDLDFAIRARNAGFKIQCVKNSVIIRKIKFIQSLALNSWKGYFMYRNFFKVQLKYSYRLIAITRIIMIFSLVFLHSLFTGRIKSIHILLHALKDAFAKDFPINSKFKP